MAKILIAEDRRGMLLLLTKEMEKKGHIVEGVRNGSEALEKIKEKSYDLIIADLRMPGADGLEALDGMEILEEAKRINPQIPVIMITAYGTIDIAVEAMKKGAFDFITKPFSISEVGVKAERALKERKVEK